MRLKLWVIYNSVKNIKHKILLGQIMFLDGHPSSRANLLAEYVTPLHTFCQSQFLLHSPPWPLAAQPHTCRLYCHSERNRALQDNVWHFVLWVPLLQSVGLNYPVPGTCWVLHSICWMNEWVMLRQTCVTAKGYRVCSLGVRVVKCSRIR